MPKDTVQNTFGSSQDAAKALIAMNGSSHIASESAHRFKHPVSHTTIINYARGKKTGLNQDINAAFCAQFAEEYAEENGVEASHAAKLAELWLEMKDAALDVDPSNWKDVTEKVETLVTGRDDLFSNMLRFSARWHLPRRAWALPNDKALFAAENQLRRSIAGSDFGLADSDFDGVLSLEKESYSDDSVETEQRRKAEILLDWQRDPRFSPTGILLSTAITELLQLATLRGIPTLTEALRGLVAEGRLPLLFAAGRVFNDKYTLIAATEALAETRAYVDGAPEFLKSAFARAVELVEHVTDTPITEIPGYEKCAGPILQQDVIKLKKGDL